MSRRNAWKWFGVQTLYRMEPKGRPVARDKDYSADVTLVETRVLLIRARNADEAIRKAEADAREYAARQVHRNPYGQQVKCRYLESADAFEIFDEISSSAEVFSATEIVPRKVSDAKIRARPIGANETKKLLALRRNILDLVFSGPAQGVQLTAEECQTVDALQRLLSK